MWDLAVREDDYAAAASMVSRMKSPPPSMQILLTFAQGDSAARSAAVERARGLDSHQSQIAGRFVATFLQDFAAAESLARLDLQERRSLPIRQRAQTFLAWLELARGRWSASKAAFAAAQRVDEASPLIAQRAMAASLPFLAVPRSDLESIRAELAAANPGAEAAEPNAGLAVRLQPHLRLYLLGLLSARLGDQPGALRFAAEIERTEAPPESRDVIRGLAQTVRADVAAQSGRIAQTGPVDRGAIPLELVSVRLFTNAREYTLEHARYLHVLQLRAKEQNNEALRWIETAFQGSPSEIVYLAPMHLLQGEIYERLGEREQALDHYRRFVSLWRDCDPALQPRVAEAKVAIARLERRTG
jgi:tetratricopeptide (TPR) repeat protein